MEEERAFQANAKAAVGVSVVLSGNLKDNVFDLEDKGKRMCVIKP